MTHKATRKYPETPPDALEFGTWRGVSIRKVPTEYLCWMMREGIMGSEASEEVQRRKKEHSM